jgi:hypothetical protein
MVHIFRPVLLRIENFNPFYLTQFNIFLLENLIKQMSMSTEDFNLPSFAFFSTNLSSSTNQQSPGSYQVK